MNIIRWVVNLFTRRGKALSLYRRGMRFANERNHQAAIVEYTAVIELNGAPADVKAMALFNRGLVLMAAGDYRKSVTDLEEVLATEEAPRNVKTMARQKLVKREARQGNSLGSET